MPRNDLIMVRDRQPRDGKGVDNLLAQLGKYLRDPANKYVQKIVVHADLSYLYFEKLVSKDTAADFETGITLQEAIRRVKMVELPFDLKATQKASPTEYLFGMFKKIHAAGYEAVHLLVGNDSDIYEWLSIPRTSDKVFGAALVVLPDLGKDVMVLTGSRTRDGSPEDIEYSVKGNIP